MDDTHHVVITQAALADLEEIAAHVRQASPQNAPTVSEKIVDAIDGLGFMPRRFKQVGASRRRGSPVHAVVVRPFIIYYRVDDSPAAVFVLNVRHGARRQPQRFD